MYASEPQINREDVVAELYAQIRHVTAILKGRRGNVRRSLIGWKSALEDARESVAEGTTECHGLATARDWRETEGAGREPE